MAVSPTARRWVGFLAATVVVAVAAWTVRHRLYGGGAAPPAVPPAPVPAAPEGSPPAPAFAPVHVVPGEVIFSIDLGVVVEIDFEAPGRTVVIRRSAEGSGGAPRGDFALSVKADGAHAQSCPGGPALKALLERLSSITVTRVIAADEAVALQQRFGSTAATLRIRDSSALDPKEFRVLFPDTAPPLALLLDGPALYETSLPRALFDQLSAGCDALGRSAGR